MFAQRIGSVLFFVRGASCSRLSQLTLFRLCTFSVIGGIIFRYQMTSRTVYAIRLPTNDSWAIWKLPFWLRPRRRQLTLTSRALIPSKYTALQRLYIIPPPLHSHGSRNCRPPDDVRHSKDTVQHHRRYQWSIGHSRQCMNIPISYLFLVS